MKKLFSVLSFSLLIFLSTATAQDTTRLLQEGIIYKIVGMDSAETSALMKLNIQAVISGDYNNGDFFTSKPVFIMANELIPPRQRVTISRLSMKGGAYAGGYHNIERRNVINPPTLTAIVLTIVFAMCFMYGFIFIITGLTLGSRKMVLKSLFFIVVVVVVYVFLAHTLYS